MFNFNLKETAIYSAVKWEKFPLFRFAKPLRVLFFILFLAASLLFLYGFLPQNFSQPTSQFVFGAAIILFVIFSFFWIIEAFVRQKLKKPKLKAAVESAVAEPEKYNLAEFLSFEVAKAVSRSQKSRYKIIAACHVFYFLLKDNPKLNFIFVRLLLRKSDIEEALKGEMENFISKGGAGLAGNTGEGRFDLTFQDFILDALQIVRDKGHAKVEMGDAVIALSNQDLALKKILIQAKLKTEDIENLVWFMEKSEERIEKRKKFWEYENLAKKGTLAKAWTSGYTITLDRFSTDVTEGIRKILPEIIGHQKEIELLERVLARHEINNALIVGDPGTGRKSMIYALAEKSLQGKILPEVNYKRVVELNMPELVSKIENIEEVEATLNRLLEESVAAGNVILVIDEIHNYIGQTARAGVVDISAIILPYLKLPEFQIIGITTYEGLHANIQRNPSVLSLFEKVEVTGISARETILFLGNMIPAVESKYKIFISYPAIREIISLTDRYFPSLPFPEKALSVFDALIAYVAGLPGERVVLPRHVAKVMSEKAEVPVGEVEAREREILLNLESLIHQRIVNQDEAVKDVATALRRARSEITVRKGPMGVFPFLGPTGVGKTETSKALAEVYFGQESRMIRLDMSEFQDVRDIKRLIGSESETGLLTNPVRETPFSLILLDEFEKAHPSILNLFLQVFDEGRLTDGAGRVVDFKNTIIIATSNAGYQIILEALKKQTEWNRVKEILLDYLFKEGIMRPELINRFDSAVVFKPLTKENLLDIADLLLRKLSKNLKEKGIEFIITPELKEKIVELGYSPVFGAREMRRVIQANVENALAEALLSHKLVRGNSVTINPQDFSLVINQ